MIALQMPRKRISISVDTDILSVLAERAIDLNTSVSRMAETALIEYSKKMGLVAETYKPLGETRGGDRTTSEEDSET